MSNHEAIVGKDIVSTSRSYWRVVSHNFSGPSPESLANTKHPKKRVKLESPESPTSTPGNATTNDISDESDAHPMPSGKYRANTKRPSRRTCTMTSRGCGTNAIPPEGDDQDLPAARDASPAKTSTRQTRGSVVANNKSATFAKPKSTTSSTARLEPSEKPLHDGNILERLGRFPGLSPPRPTTEDEEEDESDHSVTQEQDLPRPTQAVTKYQRSNNTVAKSSTNRRQNSKKEVKGKIIAAVDL